MGVTRIHLGDGQVDCKILIMIIIKEEGLLQKVESSAKTVDYIVNMLCRPYFI